MTFIKEITLDYCPFKINGCGDIMYDSEYSPIHITKEYIQSLLDKIDMDCELDFENTHIIITLENDVPILLSDYKSQFKKIFNSFKINSFDIKYSLFDLHENTNLQAIKYCIDVDKITDKHRKYEINEIIDVDDKVKISINKKVERGLIPPNIPAYRFSNILEYNHIQNGEYIKLYDIEKIDNCFGEILE